MTSAMKTPRPMSRSQLMFLTVLVLLAVLGVLLWFNDPAHQPSGRSRVDWPSAAPAKP
jgi:hypothetical protein